MNHAQRIRELQDRLELPLLVTSLPNIRYLTGFSGSNAFLLVMEDAAVFVTDGRYGEVAASLLDPLDAMELVVYSGSVSPAVAGVLAQVDRVGLEAPHVSWGFVRDVRSAVEAELVPVSGLVEQGRMVKDEHEVAALRAAAAAGDSAFAAVESLAAGASTERELGWALVDHMRRHGAEQAGWEPIVAVGAHAARPHHRAGRGELTSGLLLLDYGCVVDGYHSDMTRTVWRGGDLDVEMERVYGAVLEANLAGIEAARPGATGHDVDAACREVLRGYGLEVHFIHSTGHGVGLEIHEDPRAAQKSAHVLEPGNVITVEPGVYLEGRGGVRIEDMVLITATGNEVLTTSPKEHLAA